MDGHMSCYGWVWVGMDGHRSLLMVVGLSMGTNSKENVGLCSVGPSLKRSVKRTWSSSTFSTNETERVVEV